MMLEVAVVHQLDKQYIIIIDKKYKPGYLEDELYSFLTASFGRKSKYDFI